MIADFRIAVLASGSGTNLQAILDQLHGKEVEVAGVVSDKPEARALERAAAAGVDTAAFPGSDFASREARDGAIASWLDEREIQLIVLAGYMQLLSPPFIARFPYRIVNIHPALLPAFPGLDAVGQALDYGVRVTGVTVHFVDEGVDSGPVILQEAVPVPADRDSRTLEQAIHATEHRLYPEAIRLIASGLVHVDEAEPRLVRIDAADVT